MDPSKENKLKMEKYQIDNSIGAGSFGVVYKAKVKTTNETVAIKKVFQDRRYKNRELTILKLLSHQNVIKMREYFFTSTDNNENLDINEDNLTEDVYLNVVMDYFPDTLSRVIRGYHKIKKEIPPNLVRIYSYQLLRSIAYIHSRGICHRDIKPQNILVDISNNIIKLCDFGSAKKLNPQESNISYICSRYYRAPELIFNSCYYTNAVDVWSIGCVIVELITGIPVFPGECSVDQLVEIIKMLGTPSKKEIYEMNPNYVEYKFPIIKCFTWKQILKQYTNINELFIDLIKKLLTYSPIKRLTAYEALSHQYFDPLRENGSGDRGLDLVLFSFTDEERIACGNGLIERLIPSWFENK